MVLAVIKIFNSWRVEEFNTQEEADTWLAERHEKQKKHYPEARFEMTIYFVSDKKVRE